MRLELTDEELAKYTNQAFLDHIKKRSETSKTVQYSNKNHDPLFDAASGRKVDWTKPNRPETGVSIQIGIGG